MMICAGFHIISRSLFDCAHRMEFIPGIESVFNVYSRIFAARNPRRPIIWWARVSFSAISVCLLVLGFLSASSIRASIVEFQCCEHDTPSISILNCCNWFDFIKLSEFHESGRWYRSTPTAIKASAAQTSDEFSGPFARTRSTMRNKFQDRDAKKATNHRV